MLINNVTELQFFVIHSTTFFHKCLKLKSIYFILFLFKFIHLLLTRAVFLFNMHLKYDNINVFILLFLQLLFLLHMYYCHSIPNELKFDCIPKEKSDEVTCKRMNCSWTPANQTFTRWPWCYYPECYNNYNTINISKTSTGVVAFYNLSVASSYKKNIQILRLDVIFETPQRLRITVPINLYYNY